MAQSRALRCDSGSTRRVNSRFVRRALLIVLSGLLLAGCGGEETVSPTGPVEGTLPQAEKGNPEAGKMVYADNGCGGCHTFEPAGTSGTTGPNLDETLQGKDAAFIEESIVDPNAEVASGFAENVMPQDYGSQLSQQELADLVAFLQPAS
jgi:mono/diheme cytochrome c family protein